MILMMLNDLKDTDLGLIHPENKNSILMETTIIPIVLEIPIADAMRS